jgi:hypothetical protein
LLQQPRDFAKAHSGLNGKVLILEFLIVLKINRGIDARKKTGVNDKLDDVMQGTKKQISH